MVRGRSSSLQGAGATPAQSALARWAMQRVRAGLQRLTRLSLLMGSMAEGLRCHEMVRSHAAARQDPEAVREKQGKVVAALLAARPEQGFPEQAAAGASAAAAANAGRQQQQQQHRFLVYVERQLAFHMRQALADADDVEETWLSHPDPLVREAAALAAGSASPLRKRAELRESRGDRRGAAEVLRLAGADLG